MVKLHQVNLSAILGNPKINRPRPTDGIVCLIMATHKTRQRPSQQIM